MGKGFLKRVAHTINEHGNRTLYKDGFDAWYNAPTTGNVIAQRTADITHAYKKVHPERVTWRGILPQFEEEAARWYYATQLGEHTKGHAENKANTTLSQQAAALSLAGQLAGSVPNIYTKIAGTIASIPDQIYDWAALIDTPKPSTTGNLIVDYLEPIAKIATPHCKYDDYLFKGLSMLGNASDAASVAGKDLFSWADKHTNNKSLTARVEQK